MMPSTAGKFTEGRLLARNALWSLAGQCLPLPVALLSIPVLIRGMGTDRFGILSLGWATIGYFGFFEFGFGRALTKIISEKLNDGHEGEIRGIFRTAFGPMMILGLAGMAVMIILSPPMVNRWLAVPDSLKGETLKAFYILSVSIPIIIATSAYAGVLEAYQKFRQITYIRTLTGVFNFIGPVAVLFLTKDLTVVMLVLVIGRAATMALYAWMSGSTMPKHSGPSSGKQELGLLLKFGGWITVSSIISPFMVYLDRFFIGSVISVSAVAWYTTPYEAVTKLWIIPGAIMSVIFPAFSAGGGDSARTARLYRRSLKYIFLVMFPLAFLVMAFAYEILSFWVGTNMAVQGAGALRWLAAGVFVNSVARVPFTLVQGLGRPDLTAKLHLAELPVYMALLWLLTARFGIAGVAAAWTLRHVVEIMALLVMADRITGWPRRVGIKLAWGLGAVILLAAGTAFDVGFAAKCAAAVLGLFVFGVFSWFVALAPDERAFCRLHH